MSRLTQFPLSTLSLMAMAALVACGDKETEASSEDTCLLYTSDAADE